jgi:hypothetical protein
VAQKKSRTTQIADITRSFILAVLSLGALLSKKSSIRDLGAAGILT